MATHSSILAWKTPWTIPHQTPLSMGFSRQEYWSGLPFPPPGDLPNPGIEPVSHVSPALQADSLPDEPLWKPLLVNVKPGLGENDAGGRGRNGQDHGYSRRSSKVTDLLRSES